MKFVIVALLCLFAFAAVRAIDEDERCVVHSDDCASCLDAGCGWCSEGFCSAPDSDLCAGDVSFFSCPAPRVVSRQAIDCNSPDLNVNCSTCPKSCVRCAEVIWGGGFQCRSPGSNCNVRDPYEVDCTGDFGTSDLTIKIDWQLDVSSSCPASGWNAPLPLIQQDLLGTSPSACAANLKAYILSVLAGLGITIKPNHIHIHKSGPKVGKRDQQVSATQFYFEDPSDGYSSAAVASAYLGAFSTGTTQIPPALVGAPYLVGGTVSTSTSTTTSNVVGGGGSDIGLSKGALAGIIIGSIIGGMLLIALVAWLIIRSRRAYPQPFRAPAAAYRP